VHQISKIPFLLFLLIDTIYVIFLLTTWKL